MSLCRPLTAITFYSRQYVRVGEPRKQAQKCGIGSNKFCSKLPSEATEGGPLDLHLPGLLTPPRLPIISQLLSDSHLLLLLLLVVSTAHIHNNLSPSPSFLQSQITEEGWRFQNSVGSFMASQSDDLDQLLDSALDDFESLNLTAPNKGNEDKSQDKEQKPTLPTNVQGLGLGLPDLKAKKKGKQKAPTESHAAETLDKLRQQTREAVKNFESMAGTATAPEDLSKDAMMEEWVKQFEELAGSQDMESIVETMMKQLLSKDILHEPMKEIGERYPKWLEEHKATLTEEDYRRYSHQYELIKELNGVYDSDPSNFSKIVELMQKMQECGQPPNDIVHELAPDFDVSNFGQLSPEMLEGQQNCRIM